MTGPWRVFRRYAAMGMAFLSVLLLVACTASTDRQRVEVGLSTFGIALSSDVIKPGKVTFVVKNNATDQTHEFLVTQTDHPQDQIPVEAGAAQFSEDSLNVLGEVEDIDSGAIKRLTLELTPGRYVLVCNLPGHYQGGMHAEFTVTP
ncbi:MAG TPA: hypothetical protein VLG46_02705 [Anaerolineae bacterium]|nr:hypothetical protein [Anaerolineae bacterium]